MEKLTREALLDRTQLLHRRYHAHVLKIVIPETPDTKPLVPNMPYARNVVFVRREAKKGLQYEGMHPTRLGKGHLHIRQRLNFGATSGASTTP